MGVFLYQFSGSGGREWPIPVKGKYKTREGLLYVRASGSKF